MTYSEWFNARIAHDGPKAREVYIEITGDIDGADDYSGVIEFPAGYLLITGMGKFHAICGRANLLSDDLFEAARFLWDEHSKYEAPYINANKPT